MTNRIGRNQLCPCGSSEKYKRCCLGAESTTPRIPSRSEAEQTLLVETESKIMARRIPGASPLNTAVVQGYAAEEATHDAAAVWGLPDFVYRPVSQRVGSGTRELGDGLLIVGGLGIVLQVKSRETPSADPNKEHRWLEKKVSNALSQGSGTIRQLKQQAVSLTSLRGRTIEINGNDQRWLIVVVIDHPDPPADITPSLPDKHPAVVLLRRDWEFLFDQLKSTYAVAQYCERVAGESIELGSEPVRYYDLALADANAEPQQLDPALVGPGRAVSTPLLPLAPAASDDLEAHEVVRTISEDIALTRLVDTSEPDRLHMLAELDRLPVGERAQIGRFMLDAMAEMLDQPDDCVVWRMRSLRGPAGQVNLGFCACSKPFSTELQELFGFWVRLRHHDALAIRNDVENLTTVGVMLTPRNDEQRPWDTTTASFSGDPGLSSTDLAQLRKVWPTPSSDETFASASS